MMQPWEGAPNWECNLKDVTSRCRRCSGVGVADSVGCGSRSSRAPRPWGLGRLRRHWWLLVSCPYLRQGRRTPISLRLQDAPHEALVRRSHARQTVRHANVAVGRSSAAPHLGGPEALRRGDLIEPWCIDPDAQPTILAWMGSHSW